MKPEVIYYQACQWSNVFYYAKDTQMNYMKFYRRNIILNTVLCFNKINALDIKNIATHNLLSNRVLFRLLFLDDVPPT